MFNQLNITPHGWLAFELNVLRRIKFASAMLPFTNQPTLGAFLKRRNVRVLANDALQSAWTQAVAAIENNVESLSETNVETILEDVYVPRHRLQNPALRRWFNETDAWWFDNFRQNAEKIESPIVRAVALDLGMRVGDYALSFTEETRELRQPFSKVFQRLSNLAPKPYDNGENNVCLNKPADEFIADPQNFADLMFLRLPFVNSPDQTNRFGAAAWREEWIRGDDRFWSDGRRADFGRFGAAVASKTQYLQLLEEVLQSAKHIRMWAIAHVEDGFVTTPELVETIGRTRRVDTIYTKDFSELTGKKAVIITA